MAQTVYVKHSWAELGFVSGNVMWKAIYKNMWDSTKDKWLTFGLMCPVWPRVVRISVVSDFGLLGHDTCVVSYVFIGVSEEAIGPSFISEDESCVILKHL
jgi:hypothetical protein